MKKKIFITGAVRQYDSAAPEQFETEIEDYIKQNIVTPNCANAVKVCVQEVSDDEICISFGFTTGDEVKKGTISRPLYQCFSGDCRNFISEHSLWYPMGFGPNYPINWRVPIDEIKECHKKNTTFYKADRYKSLEVEESDKGLTITIKF